MTQILRPRFGQPCFNCPNIVPAARARTLREAREERGQRFLQSDLVCVECERRAKAAGGAEVEFVGPHQR